MDEVKRIAMRGCLYMVTAFVIVALAIYGLVELILKIC